MAHFPVSCLQPAEEEEAVREPSGGGCAPARNKTHAKGPDNENNPIRKSMFRFSSTNGWKGTAFPLKEKHGPHPWGRGGGRATVPTLQEPLCFTAPLVFQDTVCFVSLVGYPERSPHPKFCGFSLCGYMEGALDNPVAAASLAKSRRLIGFFL